MSRLHQIVSVLDDGTAVAADLDGSSHKLSLLAYEGDPPAAGDWVTAHSGYALGPADRAEAEEVLAQFRDARAAQASNSSPD